MLTLLLDDPPATDDSVDSRFLYLVCDLALYPFLHRRKKSFFSLTRGIVQCFNLLVFLLQVVHPGLALVAASTVAAFLKFDGYAFPNVFLTTHGCKLALNIFLCPMSVFLSTKPQFCVFPATKETPLSAILKLFTKTTIETASQSGFDVGYCKYVSIQFRGFSHQV